MPKLLQINECLNLSTGKIAQHISDLVLSKGWESWIAYSGREKVYPSHAQLIRVGNFPDAVWHYTMHRLFDREGLSSVKYTKEFVKRIDLIQPDIVHLHNIHDHWLNYEILFSYLSKRKIPVIWTQHDCWSFTGGCTYFDILHCEEWKTGCKQCQDKRSFLLRSELNYRKKIKVLSQIEKLTFVTVSDWLGNLMRASAQKDRPIMTIHNGIDINVFKRVQSDEKPSKKDGLFRIIGVAAVWNERKGLFDFISLRKKLPRDKFVITLVGLSKSQKDSLPEGIVGVERTDSMEGLARLYAEADVYINPTYSDNFPTTNIEALACGTPVLTYDTGGSPEAIDKKTGFVIKKGDINALEERLYEMRNKPFSPEDCRKRAETLFDKNKCFEKYISLYESVMK